MKIYKSFQLTKVKENPNNNTNTHTHKLKSFEI